MWSPEEASKGTKNGEDWEKWAIHLKECYVAAEKKGAIWRNGRK